MQAARLPIKRASRPHSNALPHSIDRTPNKNTQICKKNVLKSVNAL
jgi:hypothetical protein